MVDRSRFGSWGVELNDDELARAVAEALYRADQNPLVVRAWEEPARPIEPRDVPRGTLRFQVDPALLDLGEILSRPAAGAASVFLERELEETSVVWTYPIRIGILPGYREDEARAIANLDYWPDVYDLVELSATATECDLLLLPANFRSSLAALLARRLTIHADLVLVMGKLDESGAKALRLIDVLRDAADAAGVAVANQPRARRAEWFRNFVQALAHDRPLDVALFAQNDGRTPPPLLVASRKLIDAAQLKAHVRRMTEAIESVVDAEPDPATPAVPMSDTDWHVPGVEMVTPDEPISALPRPAGPPSDFAAAYRPRFECSVALDDLRALEHEPADSELQLASRFGRTIRKLPPDLRNAANRAVGRKPVDRRVVQKTVDGNGNDVKTLAAGQKYRVAFRIGFPRRGETAANKAFPHHFLPPSTTGHRITVVFAELPQNDCDDFRQPDVRELLLPVAAQSKAVEFWFQTRSDAFDARVIFLHQNRVLQTLRYHAKAGAAIALDEELDVYRFDNLEGRTRFDAAFVANKAGERMGVCIVVDGKAEYVAPSGLEQQVERISAVLDKATGLLKLPKKLDDAKLLEVMLTLSHHGNQLWTALGIFESGGKLANAPRIQVVSARPGEYLPVEFLYGRPISLHLSMCKNAVETLSDNVECSTADPSLELCPASFWGLNRVIEHVAWIDARQRKATKSVRTTPLLECALLGVSERVPKKDAARLMKALNEATGNNAHQARSWSEWAAKVASEKPSLLVLLTHSSTSAITEVPALELGGETLPIAGIEEKHVRATGSLDEPVILLLGCDTVRAPIPYQDAVERLKAKHAGVVLGTLSTVLGPHAASFASALVKALAEAAGSGSKFGDVLLKVKRERIRAGDPFALTLVAYGDSEIHI
ncbi:MAG TPA: hypothetical protein VGF48_01070 [Thermoanaerobaculia bacterium]|jgi:hypothetical protein